MTDPQTPEPTPAVERAGRSLRERADAYVEALTLGGLDSMEADESVAASMLFAALDVEEMARALMDYDAADVGGPEWDSEKDPFRDDLRDKYRQIATALRTHLLGGAQ